ncbi:MAG: alpha/beta hydrolase [Eubacterium sp.]|nr:alpha/beta hydrolase [Eubacterium sp.]
MKKEFTFPSSDGRTQIHAVRWTNPEISPVGIVQLIHGMVEYIDRYEEFAEYLADQGYIVVGHDHLGHGKSVCTEDDYGFFADDHPAIVLMQDIHRLRMGTSARYPELPYYMLGHSMGSYILRRYLASQGEGLAGAIIMGTGQVPDVATSAGLALIKAEAKKNGWRYRSEKVEKLTFGGAYKQFDLTGEDPSRSWLSKNEENVREYYRNPLSGFRFTLNGYYVLLSTVRFDNQKKNVAAIPKDLPILIVSGEDDPVGDMGKGVKKVYQSFVKAGIRDVSCNLFPGDRHEILNETDRNEVYAYILDWLKEHHSKEPEEETI